MHNTLPPLLVVVSFHRNKLEPETRDLLSKALTASLTRSTFGGRIILPRAPGPPLFRIERSGVEEVEMPENPDMASSCHQFVASLRPEPRQWVLIAEMAGLALRNIDHLLPSDGSGPYSPPQTDFCWAASEGKGRLASPGLWAVRGEYLASVLASWQNRSCFGKIDSTGTTSLEKWSHFVEKLPLRKKRFERGEVIAPRLNAIDWGAVSQAAYVTVPEWPEENQRSFLQAMYFGTYLGDKTGLMMHIIDS